MELQRYACPVQDPQQCVGSVRPGDAPASSQRSLSPFAMAEFAGEIRLKLFFFFSHIFHTLPSASQSTLYLFPTPQTTTDRLPSHRCLHTAAFTTYSHPPPS